MPDVSCRLFEIYEDISRRREIPLADLVAGASTPLATFQDRGAYVPWDDWAKLCENTEALIGSEGMIEEGRRVVDYDFSRPTRRLSAILPGASPVYEAVFRWLAPLSFRNLGFAVVSLEPGRAVLSVEVPDHDVPCEPWFHIAQGSLAAVPRVVGLRGATVELVMETPRRGRFTCSYEPRLPFGTRLNRMLLAPFGATRILEELENMQRQLQDEYNQTRQREEDLRKILDAARHPSAVVAEGSAIAWCNRAWQELMGTCSLESCDLRSVLPPAELASVLAGEAQEVTLRSATGDDRELVFEPPIEIFFQGRTHRLVSARDVTDSRQREREAAIRARLALLGTVAAGVGHELNNPIAYASLALEVAQEALTPESASFDPAEARREVAVAREGLSRAAEISHDLLSFARAGSDAPGVVPLADVVRLALRLARAHTRGLELEVDVPDELLVHGDTGRLAQIFVNLVLNATDALRGTPSPRRVHISARDEAGTLHARVADNGPGLPPELAARIFEPFVTGSPGGTGLGLAICRRIAEEHDGSLVSEDVAAGASFLLRLPRAAGASAPLPDSEVPPEITAGEVFVIDDEPAFGRLVSRLVGRERTLTFTEAHEALAALDGSRPRAIICDVMMPGMDGMSFFNALKRQHPELTDRVVFITGGVFRREAEEALLDTGRPILSKPFSRDQLLRAIDTLSFD